MAWQKWAFAEFGFLLKRPSAWRTLLVQYLTLLLLSTPCICRDMTDGRRYVVPRIQADRRRVDVRSLLNTDSVTAPGLCQSIIQPAGYPCEEITVQTSDGFLLGLQHIAHGLSGEVKSGNRPPVYLQHGLTQRMWEWSFDEHATIDLPTLVEYVQQATGSQVYYVGHSQGTIMALAAMSTSETRMSEMVKAAVLLAPIAYLQHIRSPLLTISANLMLDVIVGWFGTREFNLNNDVGKKLLNTACADPNVICDDLLTSVTGSNCCFNVSRVSYYLQWEPQSTSTRNLQHLAQMMRSGRFEKFDYGPAGNMQNYNRLTPPLYDLANIPPSVNLFLVSGGKDVFADSSDVKRLVNELTCPVRSLYLPRYGHADFVVGTDANVDVYTPVIAYFQSFELKTSSP